MEPVWITNAEYVGSYLLRLTFNDGKTGVVDFEPYTLRRPFAPLRDLNTFRNFSIGDWTLSWLDGNIDIAPESLYERLISATSKQV